MKTVIFQEDEYKITYQDNPETKEELFQFIEKWIIEHRAWSGEVIFQSDRIQEDSLDFLETITEKIIKFKLEELTEDELE